MKSFIAVVLAILTFSQVVHTRPSKDTQLERYLELRERSQLLLTCVEELRNDLRPLVEDFGSWVSELMRRMDRIIEVRGTCDNIYVSTPPRPWELIQVEACERYFQGLIVIEVARFTYEVNQMLASYPPIIMESLRNFVQCSSNGIPDGDHYDPLSLWRSSFEQYQYRNQLL